MLLKKRLKDLSSVFVFRKSELEKNNIEHNHWIVNVNKNLVFIPSNWTVTIGVHYNEKDIKSNGISYDFNSFKPYCDVLQKYLDHKIIFDKDEQNFDSLVSDMIKINIESLFIDSILNELKTIENKTFDYEYDLNHETILYKTTDQLTKTIIYIEKQIKKFDAIHRLLNYDGKCANLHGHSYEVDSCSGDYKNMHNHFIINLNDIELIDLCVRWGLPYIIFDNNSTLEYMMSKDIDIRRMSETESSWIIRTY